MFTLPNFCRVCLKYDKNLIDLEHLENEPDETLLSKLEECVSEVEWSRLKPILCHPCIKRLNTAFTFKRQCIKTVTALKSYMTLLQENASSESREKTNGDDDDDDDNTVVVVPNSTYIKIIVPSQNGQETVQNLLLNVVPAAASTVNSESNKDPNQNLVFNMVQKLVPIMSATDQKSVNELLTESKTEELSIEIDPTDFEMSEGGSTPNSDDDDDNDDDDDDMGKDLAADWDDIISSTQISTSDPSSSSSSVAAARAEKKKEIYGNYVPILPKQNNNSSSADEKLDDFMDFGEHFLSSSFEIECAICHKQFSSIQHLKNHIKDLHMGKHPFKCAFCFKEFLFKNDYETCLNSHQYYKKTDNSNKFKDGNKHEQRNRKKYFIKGKKNARCDICNREFSTQSYMQLHKKLHSRENVGYKLKVFDKSFYSASPQIQIKKTKTKHDNRNNE